MRLAAEFREGRVVRAAYKVRGCTASIACGSALTETMAGKTRAELRALTAQQIEEAAGGLAAESKHAAQLCIDALAALLARPG